MVADAAGARGAQEGEIEVAQGEEQPVEGEMGECRPKEAPFWQDPFAAYHQEGEKAPIPIQTTASNDNRSYHVSSRKIAARLGYRPQRTIEDAIRDLCSAFKSGKFHDSLTNEEYINVKTVKKLELR